MDLNENIIQRLPRNNLDTYSISLMKVYNEIYIPSLKHKFLKSCLSIFICLFICLSFWIGKGIQFSVFLEELHTLLHPYFCHEQGMIESQNQKMDNIGRDKNGTPKLMEHDCVQISFKYLSEETLQTVWTIYSSSRSPAQ